MIYILVPILILLIIVFVFALAGKRMEFEDAACKEFVSNFLDGKPVEFEIRKFPFFLHALLLAIFGVLFFLFSPLLLFKYAGVVLLVASLVKVRKATATKSIRLTEDYIECGNKKFNWGELSGVEIFKFFTGEYYATHLRIFMKSPEWHNGKQKKKAALSIGSGTVTHFQALSECVHRKLGVPFT